MNLFGNARAFICHAKLHADIGKSVRSNLDFSAGWRVLEGLGYEVVEYGADPPLQRRRFLILPHEVVDPMPDYENVLTD